MKLSLPSIEEMFGAGVHFGHKKNKWHPKMKPYIAGVLNAVHVIDLEQVLPKLEVAITFLKEATEQNKTILFVGVGASHKKLVQEIAEACNMPYINEKWTGGLLTNFKAISKRLEHFRDLEKKRMSGELAKYTKKEQHLFAKELERLQKKFGGIKNMLKIPDLLFVVNGRDNSLAITETRRAGIPVVGLCDTNINPALFDYPIPANDDAISSVKLILETVKNNIVKDNVEAAK